MDENVIIVRNYDGETVTLDLNKIIEAIMASVEESVETLEEIREMAMEAISRLLQEFAHHIFRYVRGKKHRRQRSLFSIIIYLWIPQYRERQYFIQTYDGISHMLRRVYLRCHARTTSNTDDSQAHQCVTC